MDIEQILDGATSLPEVFFNLGKKFPAFSVYEQALLAGSDTSVPAEDRERTWLARNYQEVSARIKIIANFLINNGAVKGDRIAIISNSRAEWMEADLAILAAGCISVSVYQSLTPSDIAYILYDSGAQHVFVENEEQLEKIRQITASEVSIPAVEDRPSQNVRLTIKKIISFEPVTAGQDVITLKEVLNSTLSERELPYHKLNRSDLASLVYTSGTTGPAKGVMQTHGNHLSNIRQAHQSGLFKEDSSFMIVLPLAHSFAKLMGYICFLTTALAKFPAVADPKSSKLNAKSVTKDISACNAQIFPLVPRMLEKMQEGVAAQAEKKGVAGALLRIALRQAGHKADSLRDNQPGSVLTELGYALTKPLRSLIKKKLFGSNFRYAISGGAKLPQDVSYFFDAMQIEVLEGYGLTETCVATNVNRFGKKKIGTVGPVLAKDIEIRIEHDGEILFRGPNITQGYWQRPAATKDAWDNEGWFHTGDIGKLDADGFLSITGRKKEIIVTSGGKKIAPDPIEGKLKTIRHVSQAVLYGEGRPFCVALLTVDPLIAGSASADELHELIWREVELINKMLASFETIKRIHILPEDFTIENGLLTPTMKVKRNEVFRRYEKILHDLFER